MEERRLIALAQHGSEQSIQELVLRHIGFVIFRLQRRVFPDLLPRFGEDLLAETIPVLHAKIQTYDLDYCDKSGQPKPVKFASYIWKRIDGQILDSLKRELENDKKLVRESDDPRWEGALARRIHKKEKAVRSYALPSDSFLGGSSYVGLPSEEEPSFDSFRCTEP